VLHQLKSAPSQLHIADNSAQINWLMSCLDSVKAEFQLVFLGAAILPKRYYARTGYYGAWAWLGSHGSNFVMMYK
jgi:hypothetical protein